LTLGNKVTFVWNVINPDSMYIPKFGKELKARAPSEIWIETGEEGYPGVAGISGGISF